MLTTDELSSLTLPEGVPATAPDLWRNLKLIQALADSEFTSLKEIAKAAGLSTATIRNICKNKHTPQNKTVQRLSDALKKSPCTFGFTPCNCLNCTKARVDLLERIERGNHYSEQLPTERCWPAATAESTKVVPLVENHSCPKCLAYKAQLDLILKWAYCTILFLVVTALVGIISWFQ